MARRTQLRVNASHVGMPAVPLVPLIREHIRRGVDPGRIVIVRDTTIKASGREHVRWSVVSEEKK